MAPPSRVLEASALGASAELFSFLWQPRRRYGLAARAASIFRQRLAASSRYYYSVRRESFARGETRVSRANVRMEQLHDGSAAKFTEGMWRRRKMHSHRLRRWRSFCLLVAYRPLATRD